MATRATHPKAGQIVRVKSGEFVGQSYELEDWWENVSGGSWMTAVGNPAAMAYAIRGAMYDLPSDDEVVYGHINGLGHLLHVSELED